MAVIKEEAPVSREQSKREKPKPVTEPPKPTRTEQELRAKREKGAISGLQLLGFGAGILGRYGIAPVLPEDVAAVAIHAPPIAHAAANLAEENDYFAMALDFLVTVGPLGEFLEACMALGVQVAANHNKGVQEGTVDPTQFGAMHPKQLMVMAGMSEPSPNGDNSNAEAA
jgi:hypothetical protein